MPNDESWTQFKREDERALGRRKLDDSGLTEDGVRQHLATLPTERAQPVQASGPALLLVDASKLRDWISQIVLAREHIYDDDQLCDAILESVHASIDREMNPWSSVPVVSEEKEADGA